MVDRAVLARKVAAVRDAVARIRAVLPADRERFLADRSARELLVRHELRSGDAVQLASCLALRRDLPGRLDIVAFDVRLRAAARREGLRILPSRGRS